MVSCKKPLEAGRGSYEDRSLQPSALEVIEEGRRRQRGFGDAVLWGISSEERDQLNDLMVQIVANARDAERELCEGKLLYDQYAPLV